MRCTADPPRPTSEPEASGLASCGRGKAGEEHDRRIVPTQIYQGCRCGQRGSWGGGWCQPGPRSAGGTDSGLRSCRPSDGEHRSDARFLSGARLRCNRKCHRLFGPFRRQHDQLSSSRALARQDVHESSPCRSAALRGPLLRVGRHGRVRDSCAGTRWGKNRGRSGSKRGWPSKNRFKRLCARPGWEPPRIHDLPLNSGRLPRSVGSQPNRGPPPPERAARRGRVSTRHETQRTEDFVVARLAWAEARDPAARWVFSVAA
jgi:hypothetical protein